MSKKPPQNHAKPTSNNPGDVPPVEATGSPDVENIFRSVGAALNAWEALEDQLATLFSILCESPTTAVLRAYGSAMAHGTRSSMLRAAAEVYFHRKPRHKATFATLIEEIDKLGGRRNDIAHGRCVHMIHRGIKIGWYLGPSLYASQKTHAITFSQKYQYTSSQINAFVQHFDAYAERVLMLKRALMMPEA